MKINKEKQVLAKYEVARKLDRAERERSHVRFLKGIGELEQHDFTILSNDEFVEKLSRYLCNMDFCEDNESAMTLLDTIGVGCCSEDQNVRERALVVLSIFSEHALENDNYDFIKKVAGILIKWLETETEYLSGFGVICLQIQKIGLKFFGNNFWNETEELLVLLSKIQSGVLEKSNTIKGMVAKTQENLAKKDILENLTRIYLDQSDNNNKIAGNLLKSLGRRAAIFLLNRLMHSGNKEERFHLMHLIPETGEVAISVFKECLKKNPPWYVIRNIIVMISEMGETSFFNLITPYLQHPDIRVQQQVVNCIGIFGGEEVKERLLMALSKVHDELKVRLVMKLGRSEGNDVASALLDLFEKRGSYSKLAAEELLERLCIALKSFPCQRTVKNLKQLVTERKRIPADRDKILTVAQEVLSVVEPKVRHDAKGEIDTLDELSFDSDPALEHNAKKQVRDLIEEVQGIVGNGNIGKATEMLLSEVIRAAKEKDFKVAELLRDKMLEINPMALSQVLEVGEIIEEEKSSTIPGHHIEIWSTLYEKMTTEEFNALHYAMKRETYSPEEAIVKSGETDPSLFFVNSGLVRLSCMCGNKETFLKRLQPGEIIGVGQFFSVSIWTVSLVSQNTSQIHVLERERFLALKNKFSEIETKLHDFCLQYDQVPWLLQMTGSDRREYARYPLSVIINSKLLDTYGKKGQHSVKGEMIDISRGGLAFSIGIVKKENAKLLLGRQIISEIHLKSGDTLKSFGIIVGVKFPQITDRDCSVHVKFYTLMDQRDVMRLNKIIN
jgi:CRP-like cAMP-binding protein